MLVLILKNVHITGRPSTDPEDIIISKTGKNRVKKKNNIKDPIARRKQARRDFVFMFNESLNGNASSSDDLSDNEVLAKLDDLLEEKKSIFGENGLANRCQSLHLTRSLNLAFKRSRGCDYDGSKEEWENGRKRRFINKDRERKGLMALPDGMPRSLNRTCLDINANIQFCLAAFEPAEDKESAPRTTLQARYNKYREIDPRMASTARPVQKSSRFAEAIIDYDGESADEGEIREVRTQRSV
jgi:hypothetical protein